MFKHISASLIFIVLISCQSKKRIEGFDSEIWKNSAVCSEERISLAELIESNEEQLLSLTQPEIEELLGPAPRHELFNRNEKFFYYPIEKDCGNDDNRSLFFRFDALGRTKEVIIVFD